MGKCLGLVALALVGAGPAMSQTGCNSETVWLRDAQGQIQRFSVELADDPAERAQGLMGRASIATGAGMLFVYPDPVRPTFWMKNTLIPLDMLFFDAKGQLQKLHSMARPQDLTQIDGGQEVRFVLEINGGLAERMGLGPGAQMRHPAIQAEIAAWPCE